MTSDHDLLFGRVGTWEWDLDADEISWSDDLYRLFERDPRHTRGGLQEFLRLLQPAERDAAERVVRLAAETSKPFVFDHVVRLADGNVRILESRGQVVGRGAIERQRVVGTVRDVTQERRALQDLHDSERLFRAVVEESSDVVAIIDDQRTVRYASPAAARVLGIDPSRPVDDLRSRVHPADRALVAAELAALRSALGNRRRFEFRMHGGDGAWRHFDAVGTNLLGEPAVAGVVLHCRDVTEQRSAEALLEHQRLHDPLTGCPNRAMFQREVDRALARAARHRRSVAVFALDLKDFRTINDHHGHAFGDSVLVAVAHRLQAVLRAYDVVARSGPVVSRPGGDEFLALCEESGNAVDIAAIGHRLKEAIEGPLLVEHEEITVTAAIGVGVAWGDDFDSDTLLGQAETALRRAKAGSHSVELYDPQLRATVHRHDEEILTLRRAIDAGQLVLHYQPKVDAGSGRLRGVEALVRWQHPTRGLLAPSDFIPLAEENGLIGELGAWVFTEACRQQAEWASSTPATVTMCINVSGHQFGPEFVEFVERTIADTGVDPETLCVEITESVMMRNMDAAVQLVSELRALRLQVAIDDFGTGYSSLGHLKRFPVDELKIDKSFVDGLGALPEDTAIVAAVVAMAHALGLVVTAEGVETVDQLQQLQQLGCETVQGYLFSRPVPAEELVSLGSTLAPKEDGTGRPAMDIADVVLVVDDTTDVRQLAGVSLSTSGFQVIQASSGDEAIREARRSRPACVVLDVSMPGMSGFEVCRQLRTELEHDQTAIVMLTSRATPADKVEAFSAGADDYMVKPFAPRELVSRVRQAIARSESS